MSPLRESWGENEAETTAEEMINDVVRTGNSKEEIFAELERQKDEAEGQKKEKIGSYIKGVREPLKDMLVKKLDVGTGGLYDGTNTIMAKGALEISGSIAQTVAQAKEISDHEGYHADHKHLEAMKTGSSADGEAVVTIGGEALDQEALIEGLTVAKTGHRFVSEGYQGFRASLLEAIRSAGITLNDVEKAVDAKDLSLIDDADRDQKVRKEEDLIVTPA